LTVRVQRDIGIQSQLTVSTGDQSQLTVSTGDQSEHIVEDVT